MGGAWEWMIGIARRILDSMFQVCKKTQLTHELLSAFMAKVSAIMNARPLVPVSSDPESPLILTPALLLTLKTGSLPPPPGDFKNSIMLKEQRKRVQSLADTFWGKWKREYIHPLQFHHKWQNKRPSLKDGDIVLLKDTQAKRNEWPMRVITKIFPSQDGLVRRVEVTTSNGDCKRTFCRPVTEVVLLMSSNDISV